MPFNDIFTNIFSLLRDDPLLVPGILGARVPQNMRIFRASPATQQMLATYEPNQPAEGWVTIEESLPALRQQTAQVTTNHEFINLDFHAYGTTYTITHQVLDVLDSYFHWSIAQQREVQWGDRILLFTRRSREIDQYEQPTKLYRKQIGYNLELVLTEDPA